MTVSHLSCPHPAPVRIWAPFPRDHPTHTDKSAFSAFKRLLLGNQGKSLGKETSLNVEVLGILFTRRSCEAHVDPRMLWRAGLGDERTSYCNLERTLHLQSPHLPRRRKLDEMISEASPCSLLRVPHLDWELLLFPCTLPR